MDSRLTALLVALLCACAAPTRTDAPSAIELILHAPGDQPGPSTACDTALCASLRGLIEGAQRSVDFAIYGIRGQPALHAALVDAQGRGVRVRGVVDRDLSGLNYYGGTEALVEALGTVRDDLAADRKEARRRRPYDPSQSRCWLEPPKGHLGPRQCSGFDLGERCMIAAQASREPIAFQGHIMHHKFFVIDQRAVWLGSTNASDSCTGGYNANLVAVIESPLVASWYAFEFEQMWGAGKHHDQKARLPGMVAELEPGVRVEGFMSPQDKPITRAVRPSLRAAQRRIDVAIFYLTHKGITADLIAAHRRGVAVRVILDATGASNEYAKHEPLREAGVPVKIEAWGGKMHMKAAGIDGEVVIAGSMNWTSAGEGGNDENTLRITSEVHAEQFHNWFDDTWHSIDARWATAHPEPESWESATSCTDGVDNDHDHLADAADPGCTREGRWAEPRGPWRSVLKSEGAASLVKGVVHRDGARQYILPNDNNPSTSPEATVRETQWFCSEEDAREAGFRLGSGARAAR